MKIPLGFKGAWRSSFNFSPPRYFESFSFMFFGVGGGAEVKKDFWHMEDIRKLVKRLFLHFPLGEASHSRKISRTFTQRLSATVLFVVSAWG